jgi:hypothetical protein
LECGGHAAAFPKLLAPPAFSSAKRHHDCLRPQKTAVILSAAKNLNQSWVSRDITSTASSS